MLRTVISLHGIWTRGVWQKNLAPLLARHGFVPFALDYGSFTPVELLLPFRHEAKLEWLHAEYQRVLSEGGCKRPSIIAHSFGALLVARLLEKFEHVQFDKVILCGCIVPATYPWPERFEQGQVNLLRNEHGALDRWPRLARRFVRGAGDAGAHGFLLKDEPRFEQHEFKQYGHSDYFSAGHFSKHWLPCLARMHLSITDRERVRELMQVMIATASTHLGTARVKLRANFFTRTHEGRLCIPDGLHENLPEREQAIELSPGVGCTGTAFANLCQVIAIRTGNDWGEHEVPSGVARVLDPRLSWIVSTPVRDPDVHGGVLGVLNLDGLDSRSDASTLRPALNDLKTLADKLGTFLKAIT